jgi:hypothetical protein
LDKPNLGFIIPYMGIIAQGKSLWNALFTRTQRQVLSLMFGFPERSFYANEVVRLAGVGTGSVQRELARLSDAGLLTITRIGNQKHYQANSDSPIFSELQSIVLKTFGAIDQLRQAIGQLPGEISLAMIYGQGAQGIQQKTHDISLLLVSDNLDYPELVSRLTDVENRIGRTVNALLLTQQEFETLQADRHESIISILGQPRVMLAGSLS